MNTENYWTMGMALKKEGKEVDLMLDDSDGECWSISVWKNENTEVVTNNCFCLRVY